MSQSLNIAATGAFGPLNGQAVGTITLVGGSAPSTAVIRDGGAAGTVIAQLAAPAGQMGNHFPTDPDGFTLAGQGHVTLTGAGASVNIELV